jgi:hypothetical protein
MESPGKRLRKLINAPEILALPGVFDGFSTRLVAQAGYGRRRPLPEIQPELKVSLSLGSTFKHRIARSDVPFRLRGWIDSPIGQPRSRSRKS